MKRHNEESLLIKLLENYIILLKAELDEVVPMAHVHGWKSKRYAEGVEIRRLIKLVKEKCEKP